MQTDSLSALHALPHDTFTGQHLYQVDWVAGPSGYTEFSLDGKLQYHLDTAVFGHDSSVTKDGNPIGTLFGREMPKEPSYLILNIDLSTRWGWPYCNENYCDCCTDCNDPKCTTCFLPWDKNTNQRQWLADLCAKLPAFYEIDYIRIWQRQGSKQTGCSPSSYPTQGWIESHRDRYVAPNMNEPLRPILAGGAKCTTDADCGSSIRGSCSSGICQCLAAWTGPKCLAPRAGTALTCRPLEVAVIGGAACSSQSFPECGSNLGRGRCVEVHRPGGKYAVNQSHEVPGSAPGSLWERAGGGDGRCKCEAGWGGATCNTQLDAKSCVPSMMPDVSWMGEDLEKWITTRCQNTGGQQNLVDACRDVLWQPHWVSGGQYSTCGAWLRAFWVAKAAGCQKPCTTGVNQDCRQSSCCSDSTLSCFEKNQWWAECRSQCTPGIDPQDAPQYQTPWSCKVLSAATVSCAPGGATWNTDAGGHSCGDRIDWLKNHHFAGNLSAAKDQVATEFPLQCGDCSDPCAPPGGSVWATDAGGYTCGSRIAWLNKTMNLQASKNQVAQEFPNQCGACAGSRRLRDLVENDGDTPNDTILI